MNTEWVRSVALFLGDCIVPKVISVGKNVLNLAASIDEFGNLLRGLNVTIDEVCKALLEDDSSNIINYINSAPSPRRSCWGILERRRSSKGNYRSKYCALGSCLHRAITLPASHYFKFQVRDIPCGTKGCVMINFEKIEIVDKLDDETMAIELGQILKRPYKDVERALFRAHVKGQLKKLGCKASWKCTKV